MSEIDFENRIARVARQEGLSLDIPKAVEAVRRSGADDNTADAIIADRLHAHSSRQSTANPPATGYQTAALSDPGFRTFLKDLLPEWSGLSAGKQRYLQEKYATQKALAAAPTPQERFEAEARVKHGENWREWMPASAKMAYASVVKSATPDRFVSPVQRIRDELAHLESKTFTDWRLEGERVNLIAKHKRTLGIKE